MFNIKTIISFGIVLLTSGTVLAVDTPAELKGATLVTADKAKSLIDAGAKVFDVRVATEYAEEHIPGALSVPYKENSKKEAGFDASQDKFKVEALGADKNANIILQCNGAECWKSYKAAAVAIQSGYKNVFWFRGGIPEWKQKNFPVEK